MHIGQILNRVYDERVGWRPASGGIKPVHIANGLVRGLHGRVYTTTKLHELIVWWRKKHTLRDEERSYEALVELPADSPFECFRGRPQEFERFRRFANGLLAADNAVFPSGDQSSFTLTCDRMATLDSNDRKVVEFAATLLRGVGSSSGALGEMLRDATRCERPSDPLTALAWPLLDEGVGSPISAQRRSRKKHPLERRRISQFVSGLTSAAEDLASHEREQGNGMRTLERAVLFVSASLLAHAQALAANGALAARPPVLLTLTGRKRSELAVASERSIELLFRGFERWLAEQLGEYIAKEEPLADGAQALPADSLDGRTIRPALERIEGKTKKPPDTDTLRERMYAFREAKQRLGSEDPSRVLAHALAASYFREYDSGGPRRFLTRIGRWSGLLYPHFAGRTRAKRARPSVPMLDTLVRACVPANEAVTLEEFLERLWTRFGLIVGGRRDEDWDDAEYLARHNVSIDTPPLVENTQRLVDELVTMGLARRYPDNVTFVGDGYDA